MILCDTMEFEFILLSTLLVWFTPHLAFLGDVAYACTNIQQLMMKKKNKKVTLHILTHGATRGCGLTSLVACIIDMYDTRERNVTMRSEI